MNYGLKILEQNAKLQFLRKHFSRGASGSCSAARLMLSTSQNFHPWKTWAFMLVFIIVWRVVENCALTCLVHLPNFLTVSLKLIDPRCFLLLINDCKFLGKLIASFLESSFKHIFQFILMGEFSECSHQVCARDLPTTDQDVLSRNRGTGSSSRDVTSYRDKRLLQSSRRFSLVVLLGWKKVLLLVYFDIIVTQIAAGLVGFSFEVWLYGHSKSPHSFSSIFHSLWGNYYYHFYCLLFSQTKLQSLDQ